MIQVVMIIDILAIGFAKRSLDTSFCWSKQGNHKVISNIIDNINLSTSKA